jgi:3-(3-hydroxy-phenyl)propionate hydroxylase
LEEALVARAAALGADLRWKHKVVGVEPLADGARVTVDTPEGSFTIEADWLIVADGARSHVRRQLGLDIEGHVFKDRFLIADVVMKADFPAERWFWFDPPFHPNQSVLLHKQSDNVWRIDFQLGWDADPEAEKQPERVLPRVRAMLEQGLGLTGQQQVPAFDLEWASVYTFQCRRMASFRHGRLLFVGDAAHQVSPFGARGANSGMQDADNLVWKLRAVLEGHAPERLLDSYTQERGAAADENIVSSTRATDFITPKSGASRALRDAVLTLAREHAFARMLVNSGRLSVPTHLAHSPLNTPDSEAWDCAVAPGSPLPDAPVRHEGRDGWLLRHTGSDFVLLLFEPVPAVAVALSSVLPRKENEPVITLSEPMSSAICSMHMPFRIVNSFERSANWRSIANERSSVPFTIMDPCSISTSVSPAPWFVSVPPTSVIVVVVTALILK